MANAACGTRAPARPLFITAAVFSARGAVHGAAEAGDARTGCQGRDSMRKAVNLPTPVHAMIRWHGARGAVVTSVLLLAGCVHNATTSYPQQWSPPGAATPSACPNLAGRYRNAGELAPGTPCSGGRIAVRAEWRCDTSSSDNIAEVEADEWVELRQPDADTLMVISSNPVVDVKEMHRSRGEFSCGNRGLERTLHASLSSVGSNAATSVPQAEPSCMSARAKDGHSLCHRGNAGSKSAGSITACASGATSM